MTCKVTAKQKSEYCYLRGSLESEGPTLGTRQPIKLQSTIQLKHIIVTALRQVHGSVGAASVVDILDCDQNGEFILRVIANDLVKVWSSLTFFSNIDNRPVAFHIKQVSPFLMSLSCDSRAWQPKFRS